MAVMEAERRPISAPTREETPTPNGTEEPDVFTPDDLKQFVETYPDLRVELSKDGELIIMPATFPKTGRRNAKLTARLVVWSEATGLGETFDSSTLFTLPNGAIRSPDACWIEKSRWDAVEEDEQNALMVLCPDFVAELRSKTDRLSAVQRKMNEYRENGARLGWLIDPKSRRVEIYRAGQEVEILDSPTSLSGEEVLPGFVLSLDGILF